MRDSNLSPRWRKLLGDVGAERGRLLLLAVSVAVALSAVTGVLGAFAVLQREIRAAYLSTEPASATLELEDGVNDDALDVARAAGATVAVAKDVVVLRARVGAGSRPLLAFVVDDFSDLRLATIRPVGGVWPPPTGSAVVERSALAVLEATVNQTLVVQTPGGALRELPLVGVVHDPSLAPAGQERTGYVWISRATLAMLGEPAVLHELRVRFADEANIAVVEGAAVVLADALVAAGHDVHEIRVPPPQTHPHQRQMTTILVMMLSFSGLGLVLSAVLVATSLASLLARQVREIGVLKAIGAGGTQIAGVYAALVGAVAVAAVVLSLPFAILVARLISQQITTLLNFDLTDMGIPIWVFAVHVSTGVLVPLLVAVVPLRAAARMPVREALDKHGAAMAPGAATTRLPLSLRNLVRRPGRTALLLALLATSGAIFQSALHVGRSWQVNIDRVGEQRDYDVELRLHAPPSPTLLDSVFKIAAGEVWGVAPAAFARKGRLDVVRTWPDKGHGSLTVLAPPQSSRLVQFPLLQGRWLAADDVDAVVLNHGAAAQLRRPVVLGERLDIALDGVVGTFVVVGVVEEVGAGAVVYVPLLTFERVAGPGRLLRLQADDAPTAIAALDHLLLDQRIAVDALLPLSELEAAVDGHIALLIRALLALGIAMGVVGVLGLSTTLSIGIVERTGEFGVMMALGAGPRRLRRAVVFEGVVAVVVGQFFAIALSLLLTLLLDTVIGSLGFMAALPFVLDPLAPVVWTIVVVVGAVVSGVVASAPLSRLSVREALTEV